MAAGEYTLAIKSGLPQDISPLTISIFELDALPQEPDGVGGVVAEQFTPAQQPLYTGSKQDRWRWSVSCAMTTENQRKLAAFYEWQQNRLLNQLDGDLTWTDEHFEAPPQATPTRTLVSNLTSADGQIYGYPIVNCLISKPKREIRDLDDFRRNVLYPYRCTFQVTEVRSA